MRCTWAATALHGHQLMYVCIDLAVYVHVWGSTLYVSPLATKGGVNQVNWKAHNYDKTRSMHAGVRDRERSGKAILLSIWAEDKVPIVSILCLGQVQACPTVSSA